MFYVPEDLLPMLQFCVLLPIFAPVLQAYLPFDDLIKAYDRLSNLYPCSPIGETCRQAVENVKTLRSTAVDSDSEESEEEHVTVAKTSSAAARVERATFKSPAAPTHLSSPPTSTKEQNWSSTSSSSANHTSSASSAQQQQEKLPPILSAIRIAMDAISKNNTNAVISQQQQAILLLALPIYGLHLQ